MEAIVSGVSTVLRRLAMAVRLVWYQATIFAWFKFVPTSTKFYGRIRVPRVPCRIRVGPKCGFGHDIYLSTGRTATISLGEKVTLNDHCLLVASEEIVIGDRVAVGEFVSIRDQEHIHTPGLGVRDQGFRSSPIRIGDNTWIGRGVFIGPGTVIGRDCIVAAHSVVHGEFPDGCLIAGAPATTKKWLI